MPGKITCSRLAFGLALALALPLGAQAQPATAGDSLPDSVYLTPQRLVSVAPGRRLNLFCMGQGSPTVLLDAGYSDSMLSWRDVQGRIARFTRVCAYDRAGYGFSDPSAGPATPKTVVADIHRLLRAAPIATPVLYVGHSIGGLYAMELQAVHPGDIAGAVLVDPSFDNQFQAMTADLPSAVRKGAAASYAAQLARMRACAAMKGPLPPDCLGHESAARDLSPALAAVERAQVSRHGYLTAEADEFARLLHGGRDGLPTSFGDKPLIVLTHGHLTYPGLTPELNARVEASWRAEHEKLAGLSSRGNDIVVPGSGHDIQHDRPQAVADAVKQALDALRKP